MWGFAQEVITQTIAHEINNIPYSWRPVHLSVLWYPLPHILYKQINKYFSHSQFLQREQSYVMPWWRMLYRQLCELQTLQLMPHVKRSLNVIFHDANPRTKIWAWIQRLHTNILQIMTAEVFHWNLSGSKHDFPAEEVYRAITKKQYKSVLQFESLLEKPKDTFVKSFHENIGHTSTCFSKQQLWTFTICAANPQI